MMPREILAKSLLRKYKQLDTWFLSAMGMNLYRGCAHNCVYCDGRAERYGVDGDFGQDISAKINAPALLRRELDPKRRRKPLPGGFVMVGGGVGDAWQPAEKQYRIAQASLSVLLEMGYPAHVLTKSSLVLRDLGLLRDIHARTRAVVSVSFSSVNAAISREVEPHAASPAERLRILRECKAAGIFCGAFLMPVSPGITDTESEMSESLHAFREVGADFVLFGGMTLKPGRQREYFEREVLTHRPELVSGYRTIYPTNPYGNAIPGYYAKIHKRFYPIACRWSLPVRMPAEIWGNLVSPVERSIVISAHAAYLSRMEGHNVGGK